ncbi:hypothetical protein NUU61_001545 [Penicillium alfredii]|uniref:Uncharacterized protein n=1 Tax=Penicillium alfredii TaxID=1506179 RepID=A0A9W9KMR2_9EURO|nr:uncharacterized protein NUU61_001545 [Penicillium alfredii]KAJ5111915.1 hypothetical protein NUU61_001545 [Penicillium alfredii]
MLWAMDDANGEWICTPADLKAYTHILYLNIPPEIIGEYRMNDQRKTRPVVSIAHLETWQHTEKTQLRRLCRSHDIIFSTISPSQDVLGDIIHLLLDFHRHTEGRNTKLAEQQMDKIITAGSEAPETVLVFDAYKTLASQDSGELFWKQVPPPSVGKGESSPLKKLFSSPLQYS